jgi:hypothetical protein
MASFVWMLLTEPSYKPNTLTARSLAGEESEPEDLPEGTSSEAGGWLQPPSPIHRGPESPFRKPAQIHRGVDIDAIVNSMFAMRPLAVIFALAYLAGNAVVAFLMVFFATFPFENQSPEDAAKDDWLIGVALILFVLALITTLAILLSRLGWAVAAYVAAAGSGVAPLVWALDVSEHSYGKLVVWGTAIELVGLGAVALARRV